MSLVYAFLADIHGNYEALEAVLNEVDEIGPDEVFCLGDIVGYGAEPKKCLDVLRERKIPCTAGNHDLAVVGTVSMDYFNPAAKESVLWTRETLSKEDLDYLAQMPFLLKKDGFAAAHGAFPEPEAFEYIMTISDAERSFDAIDTTFAFTGHSHVPMTFLRNGRDVSACMAESMHMTRASRAIVNVGSVGQPRDQNPMAAFAIFEPEVRSVSIRRVAYDVEGAAEKILEAGLPGMNAYRLLLGK